MPLFYAAALQQKFQFISRSGCCPARKLLDDVVTAGVYPVILRFYGGRHSKCMAVAYHVPGTIDVQITETVTVIPFFYGIISVHNAHVP